MNGDVNSGGVAKTPPLARFVVRKRTMFSLFVPLLFVLFARPSKVGVFTGAALVILGELYRIWAAGCISKNTQLACRGPFAYVRNPLYLGSLFIAAGYCAMSGLWWSVVITAALYYVFYYGTITSEEEHLRRVLGQAYTDYCQVVPRLVPRFTPLRGCDGQPFSWERVWVNREQNSIFGVAAFTTAFVLIWLTHPIVLPGVH